MPVNNLQWPAQTAHSGLLARRRRGNFIDGQDVAPAQGRYIAVTDPATELLVAEAPDSDAEDVDRAVRAARRAFESAQWRDMRPADRERLLYRLSLLIEDHADELSALETLQSGKLQGIARAIDVGFGAEFVRYMAGWATKLEGHTLSPSIPGPPGVAYVTSTRREALGVVGAIVPWNFPLAIALWKVAPALACGCTVVLKPAEETPLTALRLAELVVEAGFPPGVLNVVCGSGSGAGAALARHPGIDKLSFTGSTVTGRAVGHAAIDTMARLTLELGGKSPAIVLADAEPAAAARGAALGIFFTEIGPLVSRRHFDRVMGYVDRARAEGARAAAGGDRALDAGYFIRPTVLVGTHERMQVVREEVFGPVVVCQPFTDLDDVVRRANDTPYGLAASVWSNDLSAVHRLVPRLRAGMVWVNTHNMLDCNLPLGGFKQSGQGHDLGRAAVESHTALKSVCMAI